MSSNTDGFTKIQMGSERGFGLVMAVVFAIVGLLPLIGGGGLRLWALAVGLVFLGLALLYPRALRRLNILWFKFGLLLGRIVTPVVMTVLFVVTVVPTGLIMRALGKDGLRLKRQGGNSHWITRPEPGPKKGSMRDQF